MGKKRRKERKKREVVRGRKTNRRPREAIRAQTGDRGTAKK